MYYCDVNDENNVNITGVIENINTRVTVYTPIIEAIANSIDAVNLSGRKDGQITVLLKRDPQQSLSLDNTLSNITSLEIFDNGIGFTDQNTRSFGTLYSDLKKELGGKGFGRFMFLKYFKHVKVDSTYKDGKEFKRRSFDFGQDNHMVANHKIHDSAVYKDSQTTIYLNDIKSTTLDKTIDTISRKLLEKLLIYFVDDGYILPRITIQDWDDKKIILNDLLTSNYREISEVEKQDFKIKSNDSDQNFKIKIYKIYYPDSQKSKISLVAHHREVTETSISNYVPEFEDNFFDTTPEGVNKDYMIKAYVTGDYLDKNVSLEREAFNFPKKGSEALYPISQEDIEKKAAEISRNLEMFKDEIKSREQKKKDRIEKYIKEKAPWHKAFLADLNISDMPYHLSEKEIDSEFRKVRFDHESTTRSRVETILSSTDEAEIVKNVKELVSNISKENTSQLVEYIALRRCVLQLFRKSLNIKDDGKYDLEKTLHDIIFPTKSDSTSADYKDNNLWIIDEKLNFTYYISSDKPLDKDDKDRPDLLICDNKIAMRSDNEPSNPITIFEFKRPQRDDFTDDSSDEDPIDQIIRYVVKLKEGKYKTPEGRDIAINDNTPFYGFVVCDLTPKVKKWLRNNKDFKPLPDDKGYFSYYSNNNLHIEVMSWDKMLDDSEMRNRIFFTKLGIE